MPFACLLLALAAPPIPAKIGAEADEWYRWRIVVACANHPLLNADVRDRLVREIRSAVAPSVAAYTEVEVIDLRAATAKEPLWQAFEAKGWPALAEAREIAAVKTHVVSVTVRNGVYKLEARQHDGYTGLVSPYLRTQETRAADQLGRLAGQMVFPDFGVVGTIVGGGETEPNGVIVALRGSNRGKTDDAVKPGDLFAVSQITKPEPVTKKSKGDAPASPAKPFGTTRPYTYLKALTAPRDGQFRATVITRFATALPTNISNLQGYRCLRIDSGLAPVKVRVLTEDGKPHPRATLISVLGTDADYSINPGSRDGFSYDARDGLFKSARPLKSIACLVVGLSPTYSERFPVPVMTDDVVVVRLKNDEAQARKAELERATFALRGKAGEAIASINGLYTALGRLVTEQRSRDALDRLRDGMKAFESTDQALAAEIATVKKMPGADVAEAEEQLKQFRAWRDKLKDYEERLTAAAKLDPIRMEKGLRARDLADRIKGLTDEGEIPAALELYDELIELTGQDSLKLDKEKLRKAWAPIDEPHRAAREFLLVKWPTVQSVEEFTDNATKLANAAEVMMKKNDRMGCRKLLNVFPPAYARLTALIEGIDTSNEADLAKLQQINNCRSELEPLERKVRDWLAKSK